MIRVIIIDDEPNAIKALSLDLNKFKDIFIIETFSNAIGALSYLDNHTVDVVFLDMEMPGMSGLEFLNRIEDPKFMVVFCTAYSEYAVSAVKNQAIDYLLKPIDDSDLEECLKKIRKKLTLSDAEYSITKAIEKLNRIKGSPDKIKIYADGKILFLNPEDILYCEANGSYTYIYQINRSKKIVVSQRLKNVSEWLPSLLFLRVHNSYIVNIKAIYEYYRQENYIVLSNGKVIPVSRNKKKDIIDKL